MAYFRQNSYSKNLKNFLVTKNGPWYNKNNKKFESAMLDINDGMHSEFRTTPPIFHTFPGNKMKK